MSWLNDARCSRLSSRGRATKVPLPCTRSSRPSEIRLSIEWRTVARDRAYVVISSRSDGIASPGLSSSVASAVSSVVSCRCLGSGPSLIAAASVLAVIATSTGRSPTDTVWYVPVQHHRVAASRCQGDRPPVSGGGPGRGADPDGARDRRAAGRRTAHPGRPAAPARRACGRSPRTVGGCCSWPAARATTPRSTAGTCSRRTPGSRPRPAAPSVATHYRAPLDLRESLVVSLSQSGATEEIVETQAWARARGAATLAVTNVEDSPLARHADLALVTRAGPELAVPATKSYLTQLAALAVLATALAPTPTALDADLARVPGRGGAAARRRRRPGRRRGAAGRRPAPSWCRAAGCCSAPRWRWP